MTPPRMTPPRTTPPRTTPRRSFGPAVLLGLASAALLSVAGQKPMLRVPDSYLDDVGMGAATKSYAEVFREELPLVGALALLTLACWGVLLVTRGPVRRGFALVAALSAAGALVALAVGGFGDHGALARDVAETIGASRATEEQLPIERTGWFWAALVTSVLAVLAGAVAVRFAPWWPEMGSRYDAPSDAVESDRPVEEQSNLELWKSLDEGHDPTT